MIFGSLTLRSPVVLAPMAGITNTAFRRLCREYGAGLYVTEMVTSRALVERSPKSMRIIHHEPYETPRSVQIYGVDAVNVGKAVRMVVDEMGFAAAEGILAALESSHAIAQAIKMARDMPKDAIVLCNLSGRGDKDVDTAARWFHLFDPPPSQDEAAQWPDAPTDPDAGHAQSGADR